MKDFSSYCASTTFANEIAMASSFSSLEHAISIARDIWFRKANVRCWLEAISGRSCFNQYLKMMSESTMQGSMYVEKFGYVFVTYAFRKSSKDILAELKTRFTNKHVVELDITSKKKMKQFNLNKILEEDNKTLDNQQRQDDVHVTKKGFNLNKKPCFGDDLSDFVSR
ncbi:hypothetical protein Ahy_B03g065724 [Arachis hypogaea]|uniref:2-oxo-4-hydroxy-4-carboxy-5-ureidoimidazoline decarboxylase n=1 Tax=Arachis hypogaea TaxID=3818 RepID=A0A445A275_ARAHY|nr:hypothetical protein Ahy_B03g065724 [Arachis hypogaea]